MNLTSTIFKALILSFLLAGIASAQVVVSGGGTSASALAGNSNAIYLSPICTQPSTGNCFFVNANGQYVIDAVYSNSTTTCGGGTVPAGTFITSASVNFSCPNAVFPCTVGGDNGKIEFLTTGSVWQGNGTVDSQGTIVEVWSASAVQISQAHTSAGTGGSFAWGSDDTMNLQTAAAQLNTASATAPNTLILPAGGMMFFQKMPFKFTAVHAYELAIIGQGPNTVLMPTPNFDGTTCASIGCFFQDTNGGLGSPINTNDYLANFTVFGMGQSLPTGLVNGNLDNKAIISMPPLSIVQNVNLVGWGWNYRGAAAEFDGIQQTSYSMLTGSIVNGAGNANWKGGNTLSFAANVPVVIGNFFGIGKNEPCVVIGYVRFEGNACYSAATSINNVAMYIHGGFISSTMDMFNGLVFADTGGYGWFDAPVMSAATTNGVFWNAGGNLFVKHGINITASGGGVSVKQTSGTFTNEGGNIFSQGFSVTGGTYTANQNFLKGTCTGVANASVTNSLYGTGPNVSATTCAGQTSTLGAGIPVSGAHTLQNLICSSSATTVSVACTIMVNGSPSVITCTMTAATSCQDGTHTVALNDGDLVSEKIVTGAAETGANIKMFVEWN